MEQQKLTVFINDSSELPINLEWASVAFEPGEEWALIFTAKNSDTDLDSDAVFQKASGAGIEVAGSVATVSLVPSDTELLSDGRLLFDVQAQSTLTQKVRTVAFGEVYVMRDITRLTETSVPVTTTETPLPFGPNAWDQIADKPSEFTPSAHTHPLSEISQSSATSGQVPAWNGSAWAATTPTGGDPQAGKPSRLFNTMKRLAADRGGTKPMLLSTLVVGDSWALAIEDYVKGLLGQAGYLTGPIGSTVTNGTLTTGKTEYAKTPWGQSVVIDASGEYATWGVTSGGVASAGRFQPSRYLTVHYEAVSGGGSFKVQYEDRTGAWVDSSTINTNNSGASTYTVWESSALSGIETPRVRTVWVSGSSKIYAAGSAANTANAATSGTNRAGGIFCDVSYGGSTAAEWDATPQAAWTALIGWLKTDVVLVRERRETEIGAWETAITSLVSKIRTARATTDFVFIGSHPTTEESGASGDRATDALLHTYCETNQHLWIDARSFFPTTYAASDTIGFQSGDGIHQTDQGKIFLKSVIWQHFAPIREFIFEADPTIKNGPWFTADGVQKIFYIAQDGNVEDVYFGTKHLHRGTTSSNPGIVITFNKRDATQVSEGFQWSYGGQPFWQMDSSNRHLISSTTFTLARTLGGTMEINSGQTARHALRLSGVTGQTEWIMPVNTGAAYNASGTRVSGFDHNGNLSLRAYTTTTRDAIAAPTAGLVIMNTTTGKLNFYTGSAWEAITSA